MEKTFRITEGQEKKIAHRNLKMVFILLLCMPLIVMLPTLAKGKIIEGVITCFFSFSIFAAIYYGTRSLSILIYRNMVFRVNDKFFSREVSMDESKLNFFHKFQWESNRGKWNKLINLSDILSLKDQGHSLLIKCKGASSIDGSGMITLPKEIEGYDELENIIRQKTNIF